MIEQKTLDLETPARTGGPVECLGRSFDSDEARRRFFLERLRERLRDPQFRSTPGFPEASDDDILRLSDPPYYTACPNPFLDEILHHYGREYESSQEYHREPFAVDVSEGKADQLYQAHTYHTKVPHLAIVPFILHYTNPGDIVLDGFCGSGMTGIASVWCGTAPQEYRSALENEWRRLGRDLPRWGTRRSVLGDLSPTATFIAAGLCRPVDARHFAAKTERLFRDLEHEIGWMFETLHTDRKTKGRVEFTVWSEVLSCSECGTEIVFLEEALDWKRKKMRSGFPCPHCAVSLTKDSMDRVFETLIDPVTRQPWRRIRLRPALISYTVGKIKYEKKPDQFDLALLDRIASLPLPAAVPTREFPIKEMYHGSRLEPKGFTHVHHLFLPRALQYIGFLWEKANAEADTSVRNALLFLIEQAIWTSSVLNRYQPGGFKQVNKYLPGVYYVPSQHTEVSPWYALEGRAKRLSSTFRTFVPPEGEVVITTGDCSALPISDNTIDYIFTDPPFGSNIPYADLNFLVESWHRVMTDPKTEAVVDKPKKKGVHEYQDLMRECFREYYRVLKPGRWMTVVFSNSSNVIWRAIQEAMGTAGFVVADVRTLDKQQGSYRQVTSSAVKQDLVISAYKPSEELSQHFSVGLAEEESVWVFIREHLSNVPVFVGAGEGAEVIAERTPQMLHDRMIAFFVQRGVAVPISGPEFFSGLAQRFPERDGMFFLPEQVSEYDRKRVGISELKQLNLFVSDEASAIQWVRQQLYTRPQTFQDLQPAFMRELQAWAKHERMVELKEILEQNFLRYDGTGTVPSQIHSYLSTNYKDLRGLEKDDPRLISKAKDRWYVPDPNKQGDLEKIREKALLKEFEEYKASKRKLKEFRTEAIRAGFKAAYDQQDYKTIVEVAKKIPDKVLQEDEKLLMYYDVASMRLE